MKTSKNTFSKIIVFLVVLLNMMFSTGVLIVFHKTGSEPSTLVGCWFAFTTGELWMLSSIKKTKVRHKEVNLNEGGLEEKTSQ